jgi:hypothetical protein
MNSVLVFSSFVVAKIYLPFDFCFSYSFLLFFFFFFFLVSMESLFTKKKKKESVFLYYNGTVNS